MKTIPYFALCAVILLSGCKKKPIDLVPNSGYLVPTTYTFSNVNYIGQSTRLSMLDELVAEMKKGNTSGVTVSAALLRNMYANQGSPFTSTSLNTSGNQLKNKTYSADTALIISWMDSLAIASQSTTAGSNGVAGVVVSTTSTGKQYLFNERGIEYGQLIEKTLMGAVCYYQAAGYYLENLPTDDNTTVVSGEGTAMEHHMDEAFGYFGVPADFPMNTTGIRYFGKYCNARNTILSTNTRIMDAFRKCRAAISNKDYPTRDAQIVMIRDTWEEVIAATCISYLNSAKANFSDDALRNHALSEYIGFVNCLKYNPYKSITNTQINQALGYIGSNLYLVSLASLDNARDLLAGIYGLESVKTSL